MNVRAQQKVSGIAAHIAGTGSDLVLFHGGVGSWTHWIRNVEPLARYFRVVAFDLPGYGESPDVPAGTTPDRYIAWVAETAVAATSGRFHLCGFSFGGALAGRVAMRLADRIERLSLVGPGGFGLPTGRVIPMQKLPGRDADVDSRRRVAASNLGQWMLSKAPRADDPIVDMQLANIDRTRFNSRSISHRATLLADLPLIAAPVQIVWGVADKVAYPSVQSRADDCRAVRSDAQITVVPDGGHWIQYEQADAVNRLLLNFHCA